MEKIPLKAYRFWISGRVQGVGFRAFTQRSAQSHRVYGWVMNLADRRVCGEAFGSQEQLEKFFSDLQRGPIFSKVKGIIREKIEYSELQSNEAFLIRR